MKKSFFEDENDKYRVYKLIFLAMLAVCCFVTFLPDGALAALTDGGDRDSIMALQRDLLGSKWLVVAEIAACLVGLIGSLRSMSLTPFASAIGITAGVHFVARHTDSAAGLLLS